MGRDGIGYLLGPTLRAPYGANKHIKTANLSRVTWVEEQGRPLQANPVTFPTSLPSKLHLIFVNLTFELELS